MVRAGRRHALGCFGPAELVVSAHELRIAAFGLRTLRFRPHEVLALEQFTLMPLVAWGVKVSHIVSDIPPVVRFYTLSSPERVLGGIADAGFRASSKDHIPFPASHRWHERAALGCCRASRPPLNHSGSRDSEGPPRSRRCLCPPVFRRRRCRCRTIPPRPRCRPRPRRTTSRGRD